MRGQFVKACSKTRANQHPETSRTLGLCKRPLKLTLIHDRARLDWLLRSFHCRRINSPGEIGGVRAAATHHSWCNADMASMREACRAGMYDANIATTRMAIGTMK
jgi:hypothetical protein